MGIVKKQQLKETLGTDKLDYVLVTEKGSDELKRINKTTFDSAYDNSSTSQSELTLTPKGSVTQATNIGTDVTLNSRQGKITTVSNPNIAAGAGALFEMNNSEIGADSIVLFTEHMTGTWTGGDRNLSFAYQSYAGGCSISIVNNHATTTLSDDIVFHFVVL